MNNEYRPFFDLRFYFPRLKTEKSQESRQDLFYFRAKGTSMTCLCLKRWGWRRLCVVFWLCLLLQVVTSALLPPPPSFSVTPDYSMYPLFFLQVVNEASMQTKNVSLFLRTYKRSSYSDTFWWKIMHPFWSSYYDSPPYLMRSHTRRRRRVRNIVVSDKIRHWRKTPHIVCFRVVPRTSYCNDYTSVYWKLLYGVECALEKYLMYSKICC